MGDWLTVSSWVPDSTTEATATTAYAIGLTRQSDCSLDEDYVLPGQLPNAAYFNSFGSVQDYFHAVAGLTTTPDVFANGCKPQVLGLHASNTVQLLGQTSDGAAIAASLGNNGLFVTVVDSTTNTSTSKQVTSGANPGAFYAASLRGNGIMDLVETGLTDPANSLPATAVLLGNGDGTFQNPVYYDVSANSYATAAGFTVDDVTGDGIPDIVILNSTNITYGSPITYTGAVTTLIGKGDGTFTMGPVSNLTWTSSLQAVTGVFNTGDVKDLLVGGTVLLGAGSGSFTQGPTNNTLATLNASTAAAGGNAVGSLRSNGKLDVVVSLPGFVSIFYGNGDGTFQTGPSYAGLPDFMQVTITDIDGDGNPDIVLGTSSQGAITEGGYDTPLPMFQILMGRGDGTFVDSLTYTQGTYGHDKAMASADFNGDGKADVLIYNTTPSGSTLAMLPGDGTGALGAAVTSAINIGPSMLVAAKMNHDTLADVVIAGSSNSGAQLSVLVNQGNGAFAAEQDYPLGASAVSLAVGDFNGDGLPDVAVGESGMGVFVLFGQVSGQLGAPVQVDSSANATGLAAGSLTTDGRTDLIVADQATGALHIYLGNADGSFTSGTAPTAGATNLNITALGDLNGDGKLDLVVAGFTPGSSGNPNVSNVYTFLGNGDGTFQAANTLALASNDAAVTSLAIADFNKDGKADVVAGNGQDYTEALIGNGDGTLTETLLPLGQQSASVATADLLGNGYPEVLVGELDTQGQGDSLTVFLNQANWTVAAATTTTTPTVTVTPSPSTITTAQATAVTVAVSGGTGNPVPTGSVTLTSGTYTSAASTLASGSVVITVPAGSLGVGTDTLTAAYTPDSTSSATYNSATGTGAITVSAPAPPASYALSNSGNVTVSPGATTSNTSTITVTPSGGFTGAVALTCAIAPTAASDPATCTLAPTSVTITGATASTSTLTVTTTAATTASLHRPENYRGKAPWYMAGGVSLACVVLFVLPTRRRRLRMMLGVLLLSAVAGFAAVSCGGGGSKSSGGSGGSGGGGTSNPGTTAGTYTVTVTGTAGSTTETTVVTLTVN